ncbi:DUF222 domain-containing protein, partial [Georgenia sp. 10Sc9-8]|nr:DUF222 domain-containing protein [Georgenia halotolerans]
MFDDVLVEPGWRRVAGPGPCCPESEPLPCEHERALVARLHAEECRTQVDPPMGVFDGLTGTDDVDDTGTVPVPAAQTVLGEVTGSTGLPLAITLAQVPLHELDGADLVEAAAAWGRVAAWAHAHLAQAAAQLGEEMHHLAGPLVHPGWDGMPPGSTPERLAATELSMRMSTTRQAAESLVRTGRLLNGPLQGTGEALQRGQIDTRKADIIARALERAPLPVALAVEDAVLPTAGRRTHPQLAQDVARALIEVDPGEAQTHHRRARAKRRVNHPRALPDGMASISAV